MDQASRRADPLGCGRHVGRAALGSPRCRPLPAAHYHRAGFGQQPSGPISIADHAEHCRLLMRISASSAPRRGPLLERRDRAATGPRLPGRGAHPRPHGSGAAGSAHRGASRVPPRIRGACGPAVSRWRPAGIDTFFEGVFGSATAPLRRDCRAFEHAVADATRSSPRAAALQAGRYSGERVASPNLSSPFSGKHRPTFPSDENCCSPGSDVEPFDLPARHTCCTSRPRGMAEGIAAFYARHPLGDT